MVGERCDKCGKEFAKVRKCTFCGKSFCEDDYAPHMAWERRHEGLAEEQGKLWRRRREAL